MANLKNKTKVKATFIGDDPRGEYQRGKEYEFILDENTIYFTNGKGTRRYSAESFIWNWANISILQQTELTADQLIAEIKKRKPKAKLTGMIGNDAYYESSVGGQLVKFAVKLQIGRKRYSIEEEAEELLKWIVV